MEYTAVRLNPMCVNMWEGKVMRTRYELLRSWPGHCIFSVMKMTTRTEMTYVPSLISSIQTDLSNEIHGKFPKLPYSNAVHHLLSEWDFLPKCSVLTNPSSLVLILSLPTPLPCFPFLHFLHIMEWLPRKYECSDGWQRAGSNVLMDNKGQIQA